jgi:hypothetical protein
MFDSMTTDQQFGLLAVFAVVVLPFIIMGVIGIVLEIRDRAYSRGFEEAYSWARKVSADGGMIV